MNENLKKQADELPAEPTQDRVAPAPETANLQNPAAPDAAAPEPKTLPATLGGRIQEGRRAAGLSQEALGEKLEVSRQAVSKWEADAAIPELDKLIAMSRLFATSLDALLGIRPPREDKAPLTEAELAAVEAAAAKYADAVSGRHGWTKRKKLMAAMGGAAALAVTAVIVVLCVQLSAVNRRMDDVQSQVQAVQGSVAAQIGSITGQLQSALDEQTNLLADKKAKIVDFDSAAKTVSLDVSALPRELPEGTTAMFTAILSDGRMLSVDAQSDRGHFSVTNWTIPMDGEIQVTALFSGNGTSYSAVVDTLAADEKEFELCTYGSWNGSWMGGGDTVSLSSLDLNIDTGFSGALYDLKMPLKPVRVDVCLFRNLDKTPEETIPVKDAVSLWDTAGFIQLQAMTDFAATVKLETGDTVIGVVRIYDSYGRTVCTPLNAWRRSASGIQPVQLPTKTYSNGNQTPGPWTPGTVLN